MLDVITSCERYHLWSPLILRVFWSLAFHGGGYQYPKSFIFTKWRTPHPAVPQLVSLAVSLCIWFLLFVRASLALCQRCPGSMLLGCGVRVRAVSLSEVTARGSTAPIWTAAGRGHVGQEYTVSYNPPWPLSPRRLFRGGWGGPLCVFLALPGLSWNPQG